MLFMIFMKNLNRFSKSGLPNLMVRLHLIDLDAEGTLCVAKALTI